MSNARIANVNNSSAAMKKKKFRTMSSGVSITVFLLALMHLLVILSGMANFHMMRRVNDVHHLTTIEDHSLNNDSSNSASISDIANNPKLNSIRSSNNKSRMTSIITTPTIPRRLIFTYKYNLLHPSKDDPPYDENDALTANVLHTIRTYKQHWERIDKQQQGGIVDDNSRQREVTISFLSNDDCIAVINKAQPKLVQYFMKEKRGDLKADTCRITRIAELLLYGGYYFDADISVVEPVQLDQLPILSLEDDNNDEISDPFTQLKQLTTTEGSNDNNIETTSSQRNDNDDIITFATVVNVQGVFFQAFLAAMPHHPTIQRALDYILAYYEGTLQQLIPQKVLPKLERYSATIPSRKRPQGIGLGCYTLAAAYLATNDDEWIQYTNDRVLLENTGNNAAIQQLQQSITNNNKRKNNFARFLYEISLTSENVTQSHMFQNVPLQSNKKSKFGDGDWCNFVCFGGRKVYFYSRVIGSRGCPKK